MKTYYRAASIQHFVEGMPFEIEFNVEIPHPEVQVKNPETGEVIQVIPAHTTTEPQKTQYPANWLSSASAEEKAALGLQEVTTIGTRADDRFYWVSEDLTGAVRQITNIPKDLVSLVATAWEQIKLHRDSLTQNGGYKVVVGGVDKWFHSDVFSRVQQVGLVMLGANIPPTLQWKTMDGSFVTMTQSLAQQIFQAAAAQEIAHFAKAEEHHAALQALTTVEEIAAYDWKAGWPEVWVPITQP